MRPVRSICLAAAVAISGGAVLATATASTSHHAARSTTTVTISEKEFKLLNIPTTLKHGVTYNIVAKNIGKFHHDLLIDGNGLHDRGIHNASPVLPGKSKSFTVKFPKAGKYHFYCAIPTHAAHGMTREIVVH